MDRARAFVNDYAPGSSEEASFIIDHLETKIDVTVEDVNRCSNALDKRVTKSAECENHVTVCLVAFATNDCLTTTSTLMDQCLTL